MPTTKKTEPTQKPSPALEDIVEKYNNWKSEVKSARLATLQNQHQHKGVCGTF